MIGSLAGGAEPDAELPHHNRVHGKFLISRQQARGEHMDFLSQIVIVLCPVHSAVCCTGSALMEALPLKVHGFVPDVDLGALWSGYQCPREASAYTDESDNKCRAFMDVLVTWHCQVLLFRNPQTAHCSVGLRH